MKHYKEPHYVIKNDIVINPDTQNEIKVIQNSVAGFKMIITGENKEGKIESFCTNQSVETLTKFKLV